MGAECSREFGVDYKNEEPIDYDKVIYSIIRTKMSIKNKEKDISNRYNVEGSILISDDENNTAKSIYK